MCGEMMGTYTRKRMLKMYLPGNRKGRRTKRMFIDLVRADMRGLGVPDKDAAER